MEEQITYYRTEAEAKALRPAALAWAEKLASLLPTDHFQFNYDTLFVAREVEEEIGTMLVTVPCYKYAITAFQFQLTATPEDYVDAFNRFYDKMVQTKEKWAGRKELPADETPTESGEERGV